MLTLYKEKQMGGYYYIEKLGHGAYFPFEPRESEQALRLSIKSALNNLNDNIKKRRKMGVSIIPKNPERFELIGEVECISDIVAILQLLE